MSISTMTVTSLWYLVAAIALAACTLQKNSAEPLKAMLQAKEY
jgi:hypothetical protein